MTAGVGRDDSGAGRDDRARKGEGVRASRWQGAVEATLTLVISLFPLSFRTPARNLDVPDRAKDWMIPPLSFRSEARNLDVPDRAKDWMIPPLSFRSEARNLVFALPEPIPSPA